MATSYIINRLVFASATALCLCSPVFGEKSNDHAFIQAIITGVTPKEVLQRFSPGHLADCRALLETQINALLAGKDPQALINPLEQITAPRVLSWAALGACAYFAYQAAEELRDCAQMGFIRTKIDKVFSPDNSWKQRILEELVTVGVASAIWATIPAACSVLSWHAHKKFAEQDNAQNLAPRRFALALQLQDLVDYIDSISTPELPA